MAALRSGSRVAVRVRLRALIESELALFLDKHLRAAGATKSLFEPDAVTLVFQHSRGIPRLVPDKHLADAGHASHDDIRRLTERGVEALVAVPERSKQPGANADNDPAIVDWRAHGR